VCVHAINIEALRLVSMRKRGGVQHQHPIAIAIIAKRAGWGVADDGGHKTAARRPKPQLPVMALMHVDPTPQHA
jgi:hypothetical protein